MELAPAPRIPEAKVQTGGATAPKGWGVGTLVNGGTRVTVFGTLAGNCCEVVRGTEVLRGTDVAGAEVETAGTTWGGLAGTKVEIAGAKFETAGSHWGGLAGAKFETAGSHWGGLAGGLAGPLTAIMELAPAPKIPEAKGRTTGATAPKVWGVGTLVNDGTCVWGGLAGAKTAGSAWGGLIITLKSSGAQSSLITANGTRTPSVE